MKQCYRNTRQIVELAFNVLYGSQSRQDGAVKTRTFLDMDTLRKNSLVTEEAAIVRVHFAQREADPPAIHAFAKRSDELDWVAAEIARLVQQEHVRPSDILVLFESDFDFARLPDRIRAKVPASQIEGYRHVYRKSPDKDDYLLREGFLTLATTRSAKGYDAPIVFLVGVDQFGFTERARASFYVGATRAKHLLYLTGLNTKNSLLQEARRVENFLGSLPA